MDHLADLQLFLRVLDLGSITAAARNLDLSVAVASARLQRLERSLGVRLLHRTTRRLHVTPEGATLAVRGRPLLEELEAVTGGLRRAARSVAGSLRITVPASFGRQYISPLLPTFLARHPRLKLHVDFSDANLDLVAEGFDVAIRIGTLADSALVARRLCPNRRVLCASPAYLRRRGTPRTPEDLARHDGLILVGARGPGDRVRLHSKDGREFVVRMYARLESNVGELLRDAAVAGLGIAQHSTWHVGADLEAGRLRIVLPAYDLPQSAIYAVMPERKWVLSRVRALVDFLATALGETPPWERG